MAELKTKRTNSSVKAFIDKLPDENYRKDCQALVRMMKEASKAEPKMWGPSIIGFGDYRYKYASGRENDWFVIGFSPRKLDLTLYLMTGFAQYDTLMAKLGKHKTSKHCIHIKRLSDIDPAVLQKLISTSVKDLKKNA